MYLESSVWLPILVTLLFFIIELMFLSKIFLEKNCNWYKEILKSDMNMNPKVLFCFWVIMLILLCVIWSMNNYYITNIISDYNLYIQSNYILGIIMFLSFTIPVVLFGLKNFILSCVLSLISFGLIVFYIYLINGTVVNYCCQMIAMIYGIWMLYLTYLLYFISTNNFVMRKKGNLISSFARF